MQDTGALLQELWRVLQDSGALSGNLRFAHSITDDLWKPLVPGYDFARIWSHICPSFLSLNAEPRNEDGSVTSRRWAYGKRRWGDEPIWRSILYDKTASLNTKCLKVNKFPHPFSCLTDSCLCNIVTGQCHRFIRANSSQDGFLQSATDLYAKFLDKGYQRSKLDWSFSAFILLHSSELHMKHNGVSIRYEFIMGRNPSYKREHISHHITSDNNSNSHQRIITTTMYNSSNNHQQR